jgi:hypothetical protein
VCLWCMCSTPTGLVPSRLVQSPILTVSSPTADAVFTDSFDALIDSPVFCDVTFEVEGARY